MAIQTFINPLHSLTRLIAMPIQAYFPGPILRAEYLLIKLFCCNTPRLTHCCLLCDTDTENVNELSSLMADRVLWEKLYPESGCQEIQPESSIESCLDNNLWKLISHTIIFCCFASHLTSGTHCRYLNVLGSAHSLLGNRSTSMKKEGTDIS